MTMTALACVLQLWLIGPFIFIPQAYNHFRADERSER